MNPPSLSSTIRNSAARAFWSSRPLVRMLNKVRGREEVFDRDFDILFDGFPRSCNTFGAEMLLVTQKDSIKVITHQHKPSIFFWAAQIDKPACLTVRPPLDAIPSWVIYTDFPIGKVIDYYLFFYEVLLPERARFLVLPFSVVTGDFPLVLQLISMRFGMKMNLDFDLAACTQEAFARIDAAFVDKNGAVDKSTVARPTEARKERNGQLREELQTSRYGAALKRCQELYATYESEYARDLARFQSLVRA